MLLIFVDGVFTSFIQFIALGILKAGQMVGKGCSPVLGHLLGRPKVPGSILGICSWENTFS